MLVERELPGVDGPARILVTGIIVDDRPLTIATGQSLLDRNEALASVVNAFAWGGVTSSLQSRATASHRQAWPQWRRCAGGPAKSRYPALPSACRCPLPGMRYAGSARRSTPMLTRIREAFERERRFVADASHELRTPLAVMRTEIDGALLRRPAEPDVRLALLAVRSECSRLTRLSDDLLVLARLDEGRLPIHATVGELSGLFGLIRDHYADLAAEASRFIVIDVPQKVSV